MSSDNPARTSHLESGNSVVAGEGVELVPLAAESVGVRSLATLVQTPDTRILVDPGVALGFRDQLHPHPSEYRALSDRRREIQRVAREAELIVVSHFHHDHFMPFFENYALFWSNPEDATALYQQHRVWCKDIRNHVNWSQQGRGYDFIRKVRDVAREVVYADGRALKLGATTVRFSPAVPHGEESAGLGWVVMTAISYHGVTVVHASDIQGPMAAQTADWILSQKPRVLLLAGPPTYLSPGQVAPTILAKAAENLIRLVAKTPMVIVDHHLLRDANWRSWIAPIQTAAEANSHSLTTVAAARGLPEQLLEAQRSQLYAKNPPKPAYTAWTRAIQSSRTRSPPPLET